MTEQQLRELFDKHGDDEFLQWKRVPKERRRHEAPDIHVFLTLHEKYERRANDILDSASHDEVYIDVDLDKPNTLTEEDVIDLIRAGLRYDSEVSSLCMFV